LYIDLEEMIDMSKTTGRRCHDIPRTFRDGCRSSEVARSLRTEGATLGLAALLEIVSDPHAPKGVRVDAAKALLDRAGYVAPRAEATTPNEKMLSEMSVAELLDVINACEDELAASARVVQRDDSLQITEHKHLTTASGK
jgi:hypothetical protein